QTTETAAGLVTIDTQFAQVEEFSLSFIEEVLTMLTNPNIVFLLLTIGVQAVLIEISSPGGWVAGFLGVVSLALAGYGLGILPVNWFGLIFIGTAFVLFILELKAATHGALAAAGVGSFITGALVLFNSADTPDFYRVSVPLVVVMGVLTAAVFFVAVTFALRAMRSPARMGQKSLVGRLGRARTAITSRSSGQVNLASELWSAELEPGSPDVAAGEVVEVVSVEGLRLRVRKAD
ncbi:MAG TPA: NfeD family protein, partial [Anaerolineales bacterium]|nr:NfeD family protein [Anaerolineales bacterium]